MTSILTDKLYLVGKQGGKSKDLRHFEGMGDFFRDRMREDSFVKSGSSIPNTVILDILYRGSRFFLASVLVFHNARFLGGIIMRGVAP